MNHHQALLASWIFLGLGVLTLATSVTIGLWAEALPAGRKSDLIRLSLSVARLATGGFVIGLVFAVIATAMYFG